MSITPVTERPAAAATCQPDRAAGVCPACSQSGARPWLRGPDRLHGRREEYRLDRCPACSLVWLSNPPRPSEMRLHYTDAYHHLIAAGGENSPHRWRARKAALAPHKQSGTLLDLGCSSGAFLESMKSECWNLYGIEMSAANARTAQQRSGAEIFTGDIPDAPFARESFDVITCFDVLEHVFDPALVLGRVAEWLKPGGIFYVLVPNIDSAEARVFKSYWHGLELPRHLFHFSPRSLCSLAASKGLAAASLQTRRNPAVGASLRYVWDGIFGAAGVHRTPLAFRGEAGFAWRAARKLVRLTVLRAALAMAPVCGDGESIHAIFRKEGGQ